MGGNCLALTIQKGCSQRSLWPSKNVFLPRRQMSICQFDRFPGPTHAFQRCLGHLSQEISLETWVHILKSSCRGISSTGFMLPCHMVIPSPPPPKTHWACCVSAAMHHPGVPQAAWTLVSGVRGSSHCAPWARQVCASQVPCGPCRAAKRRGCSKHQLSTRKT